MAFPANKTKLVCTIGPESDSPDILERVIRAVMNVARLNFSHGDFAGHKETIKKVRGASKAVGKRVAIMADLPGPKMRVGEFAEELIELAPEDKFTLTTEDVAGDGTRVSVSFSRLSQAVKPGDRLFLNDGYIQIKVEHVAGNDVHCEVLVGGQLRSRNGLNLPGIDLGISAFTDHDHECLKFAMENGVDAVSQSFVETAADIPIALHLDYGDSFELAKSCIDSGFSSVVLDGSHHPFEENARLTRQVVDFAHERDVTVEGALGVLAGVEDEVSHEVFHYTKWSGRSPDGLKLQPAAARNRRSN